MTKFSKILIILLLTPLTLHASTANDNWIGEPFSGFTQIKSVKSSKYMISTADERASEAGKEILKKGGNAIDAAIAAQLVLNVVEPHSSGIGGGGFLLYYDAKTKKTIYFSGREKAPAKAYSTMFLDEDGRPKEFHDAVKGGLSVGTPGLLMILKQAHGKYGKLEWKELFDYAIKTAEYGFDADKRMTILAGKIDYLKDFKQSKSLYLNNNNEPKKAGSKIENKEMADTLRIISKEGIAPFYEGKIAQDIVNAVQNSKVNPGLLSVNDMKNYKSAIGDLVCSKYRDKYKVCSMPLPSSGGITVLQILSILENFDLQKMDPSDPKTIHLILEATKLAYADRNEYIADSGNVPVKEMLDKDYLKKRASLINPNKAAKNVKPGKFANDYSLAARNMIFDKYANEPFSTTHLSVIDEDGNAVALTSSIEYFFGSGISVRGFMLNNQMTDFSFRPTINDKLVANRVQPNKMPRSSMSPTLVFNNDGDLIMTVGSPGGPRIIQFLVKTILLNLDFNYNIQQAISAPNFVVLNDKVELEATTDLVKIKPTLEKLGHAVSIADMVSGINGVTKLNSGKLEGGSDPRRQGKALGNKRFFGLF